MLSGSSCFVTGITAHSKKGIVILTSGLLYEFQTSEARAKLVCLCVS